MSLTPDPKQDRKRYWLNLTLAGMTAQVGCLTLLIIISAVLGGLWLDNHYHTRPTITIALLIASIPVSLLIMVLVVRAATTKIKANLQTPKPGEEADIGK